MEDKIVAKYKHGKYGTFMFNLCAKWTMFLVKHRWLYYLLACTWGIIATVLGLLVSAVLGLGRIFWTNNIKFKKYRWIYCIYAGPEY